MVDINWTNDQVISFFSEKRKLNDKITEEFIRNIGAEKIDGEAFALLIKEDLGILGIKNVKLQDRILEYGEKNIIKFKEK